MDLVGYLLIIPRTIDHHLKRTIKFTFMPMDINQHINYQVLYKNHREYDLITFRLVHIDPTVVSQLKTLDISRVLKALLIDNCCGEY